MSLLMNALLKASAILLVGLVGAALLRRRSAALRHWVLAAAIACAAVAPLLEFVVPVWHVPAAAWSSSRRAIEPGELIVARDATTEVLQSAAVPRAPASIGTTPAVRIALVTMWMMGSAISLAILMIGMARLSWLAAHAEPILDGPWAEAADDLGHAYSLSRRVRLLRSDRPSLLVTWGIRQPKVILPFAACDWNDARVRVVLLHELAHIVRRDWAVQLGAELLRAAYWFNPLLWIACRRIRQESEQACDDMVLSLGVEAPEYAAHLLDVARSFTTPDAHWSPALAIARPSSLERRVRAMLNATLDRHPISRSACLLAAAALFAVTVPIAGFAAFGAPSTTLSGTVVDQIGRGIPNATVGLSDAQTRARHEVRSDQTGHFEFVALPSGEYAFEAKQFGFETFQAPVTLQGATMRRDVTLQIGKVQESITVTKASNEAPRTKTAESRPPQPGTDPCATSPTGGCILPPTMVYNVRPIYPEALLQTKVEGTVKLDAHITNDGSVAGLQVVAASDPAFANAALDAVGQWRYTPTHLDGTPIDTRMSVLVVFRAQ